MKKVERLIVVFAALLDIVSLILLVISYNTYIDRNSMSELRMYSNFAKILFFTSVVFWVFLVLKCKHKCKKLSGLTEILALIIVLLIGISSASIYALKGYASYEEVPRYPLYTDIEKIVEYLPYHEDYFEVETFGVYKVVKSTADGMKYLYAEDCTQYKYVYQAEYFESKSIFLNRKFIFERIAPTYSNGFYPIRSKEHKTGVISDITYSLVKKSDEYIFFIATNGYGFYLSLTDPEALGISEDEFIQTAFEQFKTMQNAFA